MKKIAIYTLGCKANQLESSILADELKSGNFEIVKFNEIADIYIINTCTVTAKSDNTSRYFIRQAKRINPDAKIIVTGCYAQVSPEEISQLEDVDLIIGNSEKQNLVELLCADDVLHNDAKILVSNIINEEKFNDKRVFSASGRTRAVIKIQDGCDFRCSYCIVPFARGKSRSNPLENIINQIKDITRKGFKEIVLSGIHLGQWGIDLEPKQSLAELIKVLENIDGLDRYRISSLDPMEFSDELIETLINSKKFCHHLHISLQSGNNEILSKMRRRYTVEYYSELINTLTKSISNLAIGTDIIVGFPGETEQYFNDTCKNLEELPISYIHVFTYSKRKGTLAADMPDQISQNIKKARNTRLTELAKSKNLEFIKSQSGQELDILVEFVRDRRTGMLKGLTHNYIPILIDGSDDLKNSFVKVKIVGFDESSVKGIIIPH